jgi:hypothetical protein
LAEPQSGPWRTGNKRWQQDVGGEEEHGAADGEYRRADAGEGRRDHL